MAMLVKIYLSRSDQYTFTLILSVLQYYPAVYSIISQLISNIKKIEGVNTFCFNVCFISFFLSVFLQLFVAFVSFFVLNLPLNCES